MSKLLPEHLPALVSELVKAMEEGAITIEQAQEFSDATFTAIQEQQVRNGQSGHYAARARAREFADVIYNAVLEQGVFP
jgi:polyhydroxyalkanoate synthesis regulator phasin